SGQQCWRFRRPSLSLLYPADRPEDRFELALDPLDATFKRADPVADFAEARVHLPALVIFIPFQLALYIFQFSFELLYLPRWEYQPLIFDLQIKCNRSVRQPRILVL